MKRIIFVSLTIGLMAFMGNVFAQDDIYVHGKKAQKEAQDEEQQEVSENHSNDSDNYYASDKGQYSDNAYVDYDDDYATRLQRFYHPVSGIGYWGSLYNPYYLSPYYGWYSPGISFSFGWSPYWLNTWGWGGYYPYYSPYYYGYGYGWGGYGYGWGGYGYGWGGYWSGYYNGFYNGFYSGENGYGNRYRYAPRGRRSSGIVRSTGNYGTHSRTSPITRTNHTVSPERMPISTSHTSVSRSSLNKGNHSGIRLGKTHVYDNNTHGSHSLSTRRVNNTSNQSGSRYRVNSQSLNHSSSRSNSRSHIKAPSHRSMRSTRSSRSFSSPQRSTPTRSHSSISRPTHQSRRFSPSHSSRSRSFSRPSRSSSRSFSPSHSSRSVRRR